MKKLLILLLFCLAYTAQAQNLTQTVKGTVLDKVTEQPLIGATVMLAESNPPMGASVDENGNFTIPNVPIGRHQFIVQFIGYQSATIPEVLVTTGKEVVLNITLEESLENLAEVVVTAEKGVANNDMSEISTRSFSMEEATRYSGGRNDVGRLVSNFAGVATSNDGRNDIVVRGNSPTAVLWRMEGIPIPSPNHYSTLGTTGGPVSALNPNLLRNSDFMTGAFSSEYGNATGAVFDLALRNGNKDKFEATLQLNAF
ncbi:MAG: TonB-dependent receptor, partial [Bacteroidetes bacterium]